MNAQKVQSGPVSGTTQAAERTGIAVGQTTQNTSSVTAQKPTSTPKAPAASAPAPSAGQTSQMRPTDTRYSQRPPQSTPAAAQQSPSAARQTAVHSEGSKHGPAGTPTSAPALQSTRNPGPAGMLLLREVQCRQRQGSIARPAGSAARSRKPYACCQERSPNLHPGPAGTAAGDRQTTQARQTARSTTSVPTATGSQAGMKAVSNTKAAVKEHAAPSATKQPTRKQRGKKK